MHTQGRSTYLFLLGIAVTVAIVILLLPANLKLPVFLGISGGSLLLGIAGQSILERAVSGLETLHSWAVQGVTAILAIFARLLGWLRRLLGWLLGWLRRCVTFVRRSLNFTLGVTLIGAAHYLMDQRDPVITHFTFSDALEQRLHWGLANLDNVLVAILMLLFGSYFLARGLITMPQVSASPEPRLYGRLALARLLRTLVPLLTGIAILLYILMTQLVAGQKGGHLVLVWLVILTGVVFVGVYLDRQTHVPLAFRIERRDMLAMLGIFVVGLAISTFQLDTLPNSIVGDEGAFLQRAQVIARNQETQSFFDTGVYSFPLAGSFYQGLILKLLGESLWSWRFGSVLIGVLSVFPTYLLALTLFDRRVAVLASLIMVFTPYFIAFNRMGYNNSQAILPVALALYLLYIAVERSSLCYACLSGIASGLGFYTYSAGRLALVAGFIFIGYLLVIRWASKPPVETQQPLLQRLRPVLLIGVAFILATLLTIAPHLVYVNTHDPNALRLKTLESLLPSTGYGLSIYHADELFRDYPPITINNYTFFFRPDLYGMLLIRGVARTILSFQMDKVVDSLYSAGPLAGTVASVFYVIGLIAAFKQTRCKSYALILIWFFGGVVFLSILNSFPPRHAHMVSIIPAMAILTALGVVACADFAGNYMVRWRPVAPLVTALVIGSIAGTGLRGYFVDVPARYMPDAENIMDFHTLQFRDAAQVIYINNDPNRSNFVPGLIATLPHIPTFKTMTLDRLAASEELLSDTGCTFFFAERDKDAVVALLRQRLHVSSIAPLSYTDTNGHVVLMSWTFKPLPSS